MEGLSLVRVAVFSLADLSLKLYLYNLCGSNLESN